jgi:hypothetical protein
VTVLTRLAQSLGSGSARLWDDGGRGAQEPVALGGLVVEALNRRQSAKGLCRGAFRPLVADGRRHILAMEERSGNTMNGLILGHAGGLDEMVMVVFPVVAGLGSWLLTRRPNRPTKP